LDVVKVGEENLELFGQAKRTELRTICKWLRVVDEVINHAGRKLGQRGAYNHPARVVYSSHLSVAVEKHRTDNW